MYRMQTFGSLMRPGSQHGMCVRMHFADRSSARDEDKAPYAIAYVKLTACLLMGDAPPAGMQELFDGH